MTALVAALLAFSPPAIHEWRIPFPQRRKDEMAAYARRHYGTSSYRLTNPKVIVEHVAVAPSAAATRNAFVPDRPDPELHELPGTCSHFVVDPDRTRAAGRAGPRRPPLALGGRPRRHDLQAGWGGDLVPPHRRPELDGHRH